MINTADSTQHPIDRWFASYSGDHRNATNQLIHVVCVPAILWSVIALLWCIPSPGTWFRQGLWAGCMLFGARMFYYRARVRDWHAGDLRADGLFTRWLHDTVGLAGLLYIAIGVFTRRLDRTVRRAQIEGRKPSFLTDLTYLRRAGVGPGEAVSQARLSY
jgi:hypothetical protein